MHRKRHVLLIGSSGLFKKKKNNESHSYSNAPILFPLHCMLYVLDYQLSIFQFWLYIFILACHTGFLLQELFFSNQLPIFNFHSEPVKLGLKRFAQRRRVPKSLFVIL